MFNGRSLFAIVAAVSLATPAAGQSELGMSLKRHYRLRSVACHGCHVKEQAEKTRTALTDFGRVAAKLVEGKTVTERLDSVEGADKEEKERVQDAIEAEFAQLLKILDELKTDSGKTWSEAIQTGEVDGVKPRD